MDNFICEWDEFLTGDHRPPTEENIALEKIVKLMWGQVMDRIIQITIFL